MIVTHEPDIAARCLRIVRIRDGTGRERRGEPGPTMIVLANIQTALEQLWAHRLRSLLTVLGIVIAVTSTITVVGVIQGFTRYVAEFLQGLGTNAMWVWPERPAGEAGKRLGRIELDERDIAAIEQDCPAIRRGLAAGPPARMSSSSTAATS